LIEKEKAMAAAAGDKKKFKFDYVLDLMKGDIKFQKYDFTDDTRKKVRADKELSKLIKPIKFKVEAELDDKEWDEDRIVEEGYLQIRNLVIRVDGPIQAGQKPEDAAKAYKTLTSQAEKVICAWIKKEASGKADNDKALAQGAKALAGMDKIDPEMISTAPRQLAIEALEPLTKSGGDKDEKAKEEAKSALTQAHDAFKSNGEEANKAIKALMGAAKKIKSNTKADASVKAFGTKLDKDKDTFKSISGQLDTLGAALKEVSDLAADGKLDQKMAKTYTDMFKKLKSLDSVVDKAFEKLSKYGDEFEEIEKKLG
jgi:hypothetical protein